MGGTAANGGGIANQGTLSLSLALVDHNTGGGIFNQAGSSFDAIDSTIAANPTYGISASGQQTSLVLYQVTIGRNPGVGLALDTLVDASLYGSIVAGNTGGNCSAALTAGGGDGGSNVEDHNTCGLTDPSSKPNRDPLLAASLADAGGLSDVLTIPANSPAVDIVTDCVGVDQRGFARTQGNGTVCDAGAYEQSPAGALITGGPSGATTETSPSFTFGSADSGGFQCALAGPGQTGQFAPCISPKSYSGLAAGTYVFTVRAVDP